MIFTCSILKKLFLIFLCINLLTSPVFAISDESKDFEILDLNEINNSVLESSVSANQEPILNAKHAIVLDRKSNRILYGKAENEQTPMASTTKIVTAMVVLNKEQNLNKLVTVSKKAASIRGSRLGLTENAKITLNDLLYGLMLCSGNDAAICLAENISGSVENFAYEMNLLAKNLNLKNTNFTCPHGLDDNNHYTSAYDLAKLTDYALTNNTFKKIVSTQAATVHINSIPKNIRNTNELLGYCNGVYGVKTGFTNNAGRCLVTSTSRNNLDIITVVLGCDSKKLRTSDSLKLINYTFSNFKLYDLSSLVKNKFSFFTENWKNFILLEKTNTNPVFSLETKNLLFPLKIDEYKNLNLDLHHVHKISSDTDSSNPIGSISLCIKETPLFQVSIFLENKLLSKKPLDYFLDFFKNIREIYNKELENFI